MKQFQGRFLWGLLTITGLIVFFISLLTDAHRGWIGLLAGYAFFLPLACGLFTWSSIVKASYGEWPQHLERIPLSAIGCFVPLLIALIALWISYPVWNPWESRSEHKTWFTSAILFSRQLGLLIIYWGLAFIYLKNRLTTHARTSGAWLIIVYCLTITLYSFDMIMGLVPKFGSTVFGAYTFVTGSYAAVAVWTILSIFSGYSLGPEKGKVHTDQFHSRAKLHDLGKLVFAFTILSGYMLFCQLLPLWYENLPDETIYLVPRINFSPWKYVSIALLAVVFVGPILYLLPRGFKRTPWIIGPACGLILSGLWVERLWLILPSFNINSLSLADFGVLFAFTGLCALCMDFCNALIPHSFGNEGVSE